MAETGIKLSVILSTYNLEGKMASLVESIHLPDVDNVEYILVDRGSVDRTLITAIQALREKEMTAVTIQNGFGTAASALNTGMFRARGEYIKIITPQAYGTQVLALYQKTIAMDECCDVVMPVPVEMFDDPRIMTGQEALYMLVRENQIPEFGSVLYARKMLREKGLSFTDTQQMAGLGLEFTIKALAHAGGVLLIPMDCRPQYVRQEIFVPNRTEFSCFLRIDAIYRALEEIRALPGIRPAIVSDLLHDYIPQKLLECIEESLQSGCGYAAISNYMRIHNYGRFMQTRGMRDKNLRKKLLIWRHVPWMYNVKKVKS